MVSKLGDEEWDTEVAKIAMAYPSLHRAIVNAHCGKFAWLNDTTRVRLLAAGLIVLGRHEAHRNMNGQPFVGGYEREFAEMVRALREAFFRAFPAALHDRPLTEDEITDMQCIVSAKSFPGVDREVVKEVG